MNASEKKKTLNDMKEEGVVLHDLLPLLLWIPGLMVGWFWVTFILTFLMGG